MKKLILTVFVLATVGFVVACGGGTEKAPTTATTDSQPAPLAGSEDETSNDPKGKGKFTSVELTHPLDQNMVAEGQKVYDVKCSSCHKLTDEKLVGPGWKDVTKRRTPEWIMNFATNTDEMLDKDAQAMSMLEVCLVRMPNQNLSDAEARSILEFQRSNDGEK